MKIVNRQEFLKMPEGTVFTKFKPHMFGSLCIKEDSIGDDDFRYTRIHDAVDSDNTVEFLDIMDEAVLRGGKVPMHFNTIERDGLFEEDQLFAVWDDYDTGKLIERLQTRHKSSHNTTIPLHKRTENQLKSGGVK